MAKVELDLRAKIANLQKGLNKTEQQMKDLQVQSTKTSRTMQSNMQKTSAGVDKLAGSIATLFTIGAAIQFTRALVNTRKEFETMRAVLANTLGSAQAANREFAKIQKFAADTPFQVKGLTDAFVRLVNQGFKPTTKELRLLGDLAASTGKDFIQLTEAIIDAQVGEFERLKEFGIRASKQGDQVTFTFKEIETQVEFTASAIQGYILSLGDLEGVSGAMEAISVTLEGRLSALEDAWDDLLDTMGGKSQGVFKGVIDFFTDLTEKMAGALKEFGDPETGATANFELLKETLKGMAEESRAEFLVNLIIQLKENLISVTAALQSFDVQQLGGAENAAHMIELLKIQIPLYEDLLDQINAGTDGLGNLNDEVEVEIETIETLQKKLKSLNEEKKELSITDTVRLAEINRETAALKAQIAALNALGVAQAKLKTPKAEEATIKEETDLFQMQIDEQKIIEKEFNDWLIADNQRRINEQEEADLAQLATDAFIQQSRIDAMNSGFELIKTLSKENNELFQAAAISQAIINGAIGITKTGATWGYPAALPFQIALALQTLGEIAIIRQQKFERGGYDVLKGRRHAQGGVDIGIGEAEEGEGIGVFSRQATRKYGKFLPAFVKAINENEATVTGYGDNAYNIHFDDSRQVGKLEAIRELLAKPEVTYQGKYKIITRNGHVTKVKI